MIETDIVKKQLMEEDYSFSEILEKYKVFEKYRKSLNELEEVIKNKIKVYMKEREWNTYRDESSDVSISITNVTTENVNKKNLKLMLTEAQYAQIVTVSSTERMNIITPEGRKRLKKYVK